MRRSEKLVVRNSIISASERNVEIAKAKKMKEIEQKKKELEQLKIELKLIDEAGVTIMSLVSKKIDRRSNEKARDLIVDLSKELFAKKYRVELGSRITQKGMVLKDKQVCADFLDEVVPIWNKYLDVATRIIETKEGVMKDGCKTEAEKEEAEDVSGHEVS